MKEVNKRLIVLVFFLLSVLPLVEGCSLSNGTRRELRKLCREEGSISDSRCYRAKHRPLQDLVQICESRGITKNCYYVTRQELERVIRQISIENLK